MKVVTHNGMFHPDDVFAVATALLVFPESEIIRTRDQKIIDSADIVIDVGMVYDPAIYRFDHHQEGGADVRPNGVPYASFGLVWKEFGYRLARDAEYIIEEKLVIPIDAPDNRISVYEPKLPGIEPYTIRDFFYSYLPYGDRSEKHLQEVFLEVVQVAKGILEREITKAEERAAGIIEVRRILEASLDKRVIILDRDLPWESVLVASPAALFVVYPRREGNWAAKGIPKKVGSLDRKKLFPFAWAGKTDQELEVLSKVKGAMFCHLDRFIATAKSKEGAAALAKLALNA